MRYELMVGLRYLRAKRSEAFISLITVISIVGVMIGVMTLNIVLAVMTGFEEDLRDRILGFNPHIVLVSYAGTIADPDEILREVRATPGVAAAAPLVYSQVMLSSGQSVSGVVVRGVPPDMENAVIDLKAHLTSGSLAGLGAPFEVPVEGGKGAGADGRPETTTLTGVIIGGELAKQLGLAVGDPVSVVSPLGTPSPVGPIPKMKRFVVAGTFDSGMYDYDSGLIYMGIADAQKFFGLGDAITGVEIRVTDLYGADKVARRLEQTLGTPFRARDWMEVNRNLFLAFRLEKVVYFIVLTLIVLVAAFNIVATLIMVVMEKRKDIAILKSMGATDRSIARIFMLKGLIIGVVGTLLGVVGGYAGCWLLRRYQFVELPKDVFYVSTLPVRVYGENFAAVALVSVAICLLATIYPARQAAGLAPVEVIRYE
ncbi:MAG: ABC transporter permease [Polyangiaceae bacterium UTPRO1]|nr:lipoprotein-releasing ABC transporter permease subunit [Myxococcales bacterium]OQY68837.1 MAG: ABC transporter permease [Polyangiaceae bacterium UTPRO1]